MNRMNRMRRLTSGTGGCGNRSMMNKEFRTTKEEKFRSSRHSFGILRFLVLQSAAPYKRHAVFNKRGGVLHSPACPMLGAQQRVSFGVVDDLHRHGIEFERTIYQARNVAQQEQFHGRTGVIEV